jgi:zinc protease
VYHWFEHVPFRGTTLFPNGYEDTMGRLQRFGGSTNASTSFNRTMFLSTVPKGHWREALRLVIDLASQPLLTDEGIEAERKVIHSEIAGRLSSVNGYAWHTIFQDHLWSGHPYGHNVTGTEEELNSVTPATLREAQRRGYDRSRMVLVVSGPVTADELCREVEALGAVLPDHGLSERRSPATYGALPEWVPGEISLPAHFDSSLVITAWPIPAVTTADVRSRTHLWIKLMDLFNAGSLASPIMQITRGEQQLVYGAGASCLMYPEGGIFYLAGTTRQKPQLVLDAFHGALTDQRVTSPARFEYVNDYVQGEMEMTVLDPHTHTKLLAATLLDGEAICTHQEMLARDLAITHEELLSTLASLKPETARTFIFNARGK